VKNQQKKLEKLNLVLCYVEGIITNWKDKEEVLKVISEDLYELENAPDALMADQEFVLAAVQQDGYALQYANDALKADREIVLAAVKEKGDALEDADDALKSDREIVLTALESEGRALDYADDVLKADREIVLAAVRQDGGALEYADKNLQEDPEIPAATKKVWSSLVSNVNFIKNISGSDLINLAVVYKTDTEFDRELIGDSIYGDDEFGMLEPGGTACFFEYISDDVLNNTYGSFKLIEIRDNYNSKEFLEDLKQGLDHLFIYDSESDVFQEMDFESFNESFNKSELMETHSLDLITYELGSEE